MSLIFTRFHYFFFLESGIALYLNLLVADTGNKWYDMRGLKYSKVALKLLNGIVNGDCSSLQSSELTLSLVSVGKLHCLDLIFPPKKLHYEQFCNLRSSFDENVLY